MCVAVIAWRLSDRWPLLVIGNRDEYHARAAASLARWSDEPQIIAGRDLVGGGTWLGVSELGRLALVTNRHGFGSPDPAKLSRGEMVRGVLADVEGPERLHSANLDAYNPFNLFVVSRGALSFHTNRPAQSHAALPPGLYGLSNGALDEPWAKTLALKAAVSDWLACGDGTFDRLFAALRSETLLHPCPPPMDLSNGAVEPRDTPPFIRHPLYGTRCSTIVTVDPVGQLVIAERSFGADGGETGRAAIGFAWAGLTT